MQPHRKGHQFTSKAMRRKVEREQRRDQKLYLAGNKPAKAKKAKKQKAAKSCPPAAKYPCGPKQMTLGEAFPAPGSL